MNSPAIIDRVMPEYDAARADHRVVAGTPDEVFQTALGADFVQAVQHNPVVGMLFSLRAGIERVAGLITGRGPAPAQSAVEMRLLDMPQHGAWVALGQSRALRQPGLPTR